MCHLVFFVLMAKRERVNQRRTTLNVVGHESITLFLLLLLIVAMDTPRLNKSSEEGTLLRGNVRPCGRQAKQGKQTPPVGATKSFLVHEIVSSHGLPCMLESECG